jgi:hypothetical protein
MLFYNFDRLNEWARLLLVDSNPKTTKALVTSTSAVPHLDLRFNGELVEIVKNPSCLLYRLCRVEKEGAKYWSLGNTSFDSIGV